MICSFQVGQKVMCTRTERLYPAGVEALEHPEQPIVGKVYTIRQVLIGCVGKIPCVKLVEIADQRINVMVNGELMNGDVVFEAAGFRPLITRETNMAMFKSLLTPSKQPVPA